MSEPQAQAATTTGDQASQAQAQQQQQQTSAAGGDQASQSARSQADYEREIRELRQEAANYRTQNKDLKAFKDAAEAEKLTETEKLTKAKADAEALAAAHAAELKQTRIQAEIERQARKLGIIDEEAAYKLLDLSKVEDGADGKPKNIEALLAALVKDKPYLVGATGGESAANASRQRGGHLSAEAVKGMTREQILADYDNVRKALKA